MWERRRYFREARGVSFPQLGPVRPVRPSGQARQDHKAAWLQLTHRQAPVSGGEMNLRELGDERESKAREEKWEEGGAKLKLEYISPAVSYLFKTQPQHCAQYSYHQAEWDAVPCSQP